MQSQYSFATAWFLKFRARMLELKRIGVINRDREWVYGRFIAPLYLLFRGKPLRGIFP
jgi:hypothetical protein